MSDKKFIFRINLLGHFFRILKKGLISILCLVLFYAIYALIGPFVPVNTDFAQDPSGVEVFIQTNGVHLDICLPVRNSSMNWLDFFSKNQILLKETGYVSIGWGDRDFYLNTPSWNDLTPGVAFRSVILPTSSVLHVSSYFRKPSPSESVRSIWISDSAYVQLVKNLQADFQQNESGVIREIDCCNYWGERDRFFEADEKYHLFHTCNDWVNAHLRKLGIRTAMWSPFDWGILRYF